MNSNSRNSSKAVEIAELVKRAGGNTYYVGGCVRDRLSGKTNKDIDIEIHGISIECLEDILDKCGTRMEMGSSFGIFGLKGYDLDIAMPRTEKAVGRGHKDFKVTVDPFLGTERAAVRRDFTINAFMEDVLTGQVIDHFGGREDLANGIIRHIDPKTFVEDPLRVLRGAQFAARFNFEIAAETINISKSMDLAQLPSERIFGELEKALLKAEKPSVFFEVLKKMNQLDTWFPELKALIGVQQNPQFHPEGDVWTHTMMVIDHAAALRDQANFPIGYMLAALLHDIGKPSTTTVEEDGRIRTIGHEKKLDIAELALSRVTKNVKLTGYVLNMVEFHMQPNMMVRQHVKQKSMNKLFDKSIDPDDLILISKADYLGCGNTIDYSENERVLREYLSCFREMMARPYVMGADLVAAGLTPGKDFRGMLEFAHKLHLAGVPKDDALKQTLGMHKSTINSKNG